MSSQDTNSQLKMLVKEAFNNNGIIRADSEMKISFADGKELEVQFDLIISINTVN